MNGRIPAAIVGLGRIGSLLEQDGLREKPCTHAGAIRASGDLVLVAGADTSAERRGLFRETWQVPVYDDAALMLREQRPALLHVATHPDSHLFYCELAEAEGVRVVVCEKPLADTLAKARKIARLEARGKLRIITNHERRYSADYGAARKLLRDGVLGPLLGVRAALYMGISRRIGDVLWHDGTHLADAMMFLSGAIPRHRKRWGGRPGSRAGTMYLAGELLPPAGAPPGEIAAAAAWPVPFLIEAGAGRDHLVFEFEFSCAGGRLRIGNGIFEVWESGASPYAENFRSLARTREGFEGPTGYFSGMVEDAAACVRDASRRPRSSAADGLRVIEYLQRAAPRRSRP